MAFTIAALLSIVTDLAEKHIAEHRYGDNIILCDIVNEYEKIITPQLQVETESIESQIERIKDCKYKSEIETHLNALIKRIKGWNRLARPIQLAAKSKGITHRLSEKIGLSLHALSVYLNNEKTSPKHALEIVNSIRPIFAEFDTLSEIFNEDSKLFDKNIIAEEAKEEVNCINRRIGELKKQGESLVSNPSQEKINSFNSNIVAIDNSIKCFSKSNKDKIVKMREALCTLARDIAKDLYSSNKTNNLEYVYSIVSELSLRFSDSALSSNLTMDVLKLKTIIERNNEEYREQKAKKERKKKEKRYVKSFSFC